MNSAVARSSTSHRLATTRRAPAMTKLRVSPMTPSPSIDRPRPVSHPLRTARSAFSRRRPMSVSRRNPSCGRPCSVTREHQSRQLRCAGVEQAVRRKVQDAIVRQRRLRDLTQVCREVSGLQRGLARRERRDGVGLATRERQAGERGRVGRDAAHGTRERRRILVARVACGCRCGAGRHTGIRRVEHRIREHRQRPRRLDAMVVQAPHRRDDRRRRRVDDLVVRDERARASGQPGKRHLLKTAWRDDQQALAGRQGAEGIEQQRAQRGAGRARSGTLRARGPAGRGRRRDRGAAVPGGGFDRRTRGEPVRRERPLRHDPGVARGLAEHVPRGAPCRNRGLRAGWRRPSVARGWPPSRRPASRASGAPGPDRTDPSARSALARARSRWRVSRVARRRQLAPSSGSAPAGGAGRRSPRTARPRRRGAGPSPCRAGFVPARAR